MSDDPANLPDLYGDIPQDDIEMDILSDADFCHFTRYGTRMN